MLVTSEERRVPRRGEERRQLLVRAAFDAIAAKGFEGLRLSEVAAQAGIDHSTLHYYFPARQHLAAAVVEFATRQFWTTMPSGVAPAQKLSAHLATLAQMIQQKPALFTVLREVDLRASRDPAVRDIGPSPWSSPPSRASALLRTAQPRCSTNSGRC